MDLISKPTIRGSNISTLDLKTKIGMNFGVSLLDIL